MLLTGDGYIPRLSDLTPSNGADLRGRLMFMPLKGYHDGSGKSDDPNCKLLTLGAFCGSASAWDDFEPKWRQLLKDKGAPEINGIPYFHTVDAVGLSEPFSFENGWTRSRVNDLVRALLLLLANVDHSALIGAAVPVVLADFRDAAAEFNEPFPDSPESFCVELCVSNTVRPDPSESANANIVQLYFDREEPFLHKIKRVLDRVKLGKRQGWMRQTALIAQVEDGRLYPGIQAADLVAWITNRHYTRGDEPEYEMWDQMVALAQVIRPKDAYRYDLIKSLMRENS
jgi:hypothetical protein